MGVYADFLDVQARIPYREIGATTLPSQVNVDEWIDEAEAMLNGVLAAAGLSSPYTTTNAKNILRSWVVDYAEGMVRQAYASAGGDGANDDGKDKIERFEKRLNDILASPSQYGAMLGGGDAPESSRGVRGHVLDNSDGKSVSDYAPVFERGQTY